MTNTTGLTSSGLVREVADFLWQDGNVMTHPDWVEALASQVVAVPIGRERYIYDKLGQLYANGMAIIVGASGISYKTVAIKHARRLIKRVIELMNDDICGHSGYESYEAYKEAGKELYRNKPYSGKGKKSEEENKKIAEWERKKFKLESIKRELIDLEGPTKFTSEGLSIFLIAHPQCMIAGDEYTKLVKGATKKDFLVDNMEDLSRLYDCEADKYALASRPIEYPEDAYVTFTSATTYYLLKLMTEDFFIQGTGNRIMWTFDDLNDRHLLDEHDEVMSAEFFWGIDDEDKYNERLGELARKLIKIYSLPEGLMSFNFGASVMLDRYRVGKYNIALTKIKKDLYDIDANLMSRLAENAIKLSMIHCVGRAVLDEDAGYPVIKLEIDEEDAKWAIEKMDRHFDHYVKMRSEAARRARKGSIRSYKNDQVQVLAEIDGNQQLTMAKLTNITGWKSADTIELIAQMVKNKQIIMYYINRKYRSSQIYYLRRHDEVAKKESHDARLRWAKSNRPDLYKGLMKGEIE